MKNGDIVRYVGVYGEHRDEYRYRILKTDGKVLYLDDSFPKSFRGNSDGYTGLCELFEVVAFDVGKEMAKLKEKNKMRVIKD
jgi:hypothetical protein